VSKNERVTENLVRTKLQALGYFDISNTIKVDEQKTNIEAVTRLLKQASKTGGGGKGSPEFIISNPEDPDFLIIVECKADTKDHASPELASIFLGMPLSEDEESRKKRVVRFSADGALHYAQHLSREFSVIALAVSGQSETGLLISTYLHTKDAKGRHHAKQLNAKTGAKIDNIIPWRDYIEHATYDPSVQALRLEELMAFSRDLHDFMRDDVKASESEKPLFVSGSLIALRDTAFAKSYKFLTPGELPNEWLRAIRKEMDKADLPGSKKSTITQPYASIAAHPEIAKAHRKYPKGVMNELVSRLNEKVWPFMSVYHDFDVVGQFYGEFLKYTGGDKKALGIVLTPRHITELFALLANVNKASKVLDICAGTGGFLIAAMHQMMRTATTEADRVSVRKERLIGIEQLPNMFTLAASNMILRGDGKANLHQSSCFDEDVTAAIKKLNCTVGLLNPPYSQKDEDLHEFYFIKQMLECLQNGGIGIAVVPMSCAVGPHPLKAELLKHHTLEAVMSLPDELFYPVGTIPCAMVFTAGIPHETSDKKSWFGYWKRDGFTKTKHRGRVDLDNQWPGIRDYWVDSFRNREVHPGESVMRKVGVSDEWCVEAYMETDYNKLTQEHFEKVIRDYAIYRLLGGVTDTAADQDAAAEDQDVAAEDQDVAAEEQDATAEEQDADVEVK
jgi:type I restriction enzyme M protein